MAAQDTIDCLASIRRITWPDYLTVVADNGSSDGSIGKIMKWATGEVDLETDEDNRDQVMTRMECILYSREEAEAGGLQEGEERISRLAPENRFVIIRNEENLGFSAGNNVGIRYALARQGGYVLLLNNDTVVDRAFMEPLIAVCEREPDTALATGKICYREHPDTIWYGGGHISLIRGGSVHRGRGAPDTGRYDSARRVGFASGCMMMMKTRILPRNGLLDERYFLGGEDYALCREVRKQGLSIRYEPDSIIWHQVSASRKHPRPRDVYNGYLVKGIFMKRSLNKMLWPIWYLIYSLYCRTIAPVRLRGRLRQGTEATPDLKVFRQAIRQALIDVRTKDAVTIHDLDAIDHIVA